MKDFIRAVLAVAFLLLMAGLAFTGYTMYDAYQNNRIFAPAPPPTAYEMKIAAFDAWVWFGVKSGFQLAMVLCVYWLGLRFLWVPMVKAREEIHYNPDTGMLPVVRRNVAPLWKRVVGHNEYDEFDGNLSIAPHRKVYSNGHLHVAAEIDGADPLAQADYARNSWNVQSSIARKGRGMTIGEARFLSGEFHEKAQVQRQRALTMQERREHAYAKETSVIDVVAQVMPPITLEQAIKQSSDRAWVIGQATELQPVQGFKDVGKLLTFDHRTSHIAIIGGTGSGKTASTGLLMALYARQFGVHPIILDGKEGIDWGPLDGVVEWHSMSVDSIEWQLTAIMGIFEERWELLKSVEAPNIYKLPRHDRPTPIFLMMEEFGDVWAELRNQDKALYKDLGRQVDRLFRLSRATGITLCLIDQSPEKWSQQMRGNAKFVTCYKLKGGVANAFNEYHVDKLPNVGMFSQDNVFYKPWFTENEVELTQMFSPLEKRLLNEPRRTAENDRSPVVRTNERQVLQGGTINEKTIVPPPSIVRSFVRTGNWQDVCEKLFEIYPSMKQSQLRRVMVDIEGTGKEPNQFKGVAFEMFHRYSPNGDRSKFA